jgi:hypothetical protein
MKTLLGTIAVASCVFAVQTATPAAPAAVYTAQQAAAGRLEFHQ